MISYLAYLRDDAVEWSAGRNWIIRLPLLILFAYLGVSYIRNPNYWCIFSYLNLGIHELGHVITRPFGQFICVASGSIVQCLVPVISMFMFLHQRDYFAIAICFGWLSTNLFYVATYAGDARDRLLPLVSIFGQEAEHDWYYLLDKLLWLRHDKTIAAVFRAMGIGSMVVCLIGGSWVLWLMMKPKTEEIAA